METRRLTNVLLAFALLIYIGCGSKNSKVKNTTSGTSEVAKTKIKFPSFNADSAYLFVQKQVEFGPRVPNTKAHENCGNYLVSELKRFGANVYEQKTKLQGFEHTWNARNIIGEFNPKKTDRILLCAHWDSRYTADREHNPSMQKEPVPGASDGASGVAVLLEIARQLQLNNANVGVDIIFFDVEDQGIPAYKNASGNKDYWCLGSEYWSNTPHKPDYTARYGILLDMVGARNAVFRRELYSEQFAKTVLDKVWSTAMDAGYSSFFSYEKGGMITDDHYFVNTIAHIPTIDIIQFDYASYSGFGHYWHTLQDDMSVIDTKTLKAVGQVVSNVIFKEPF